jgi:uncharacterized membrane protein
MLQVKRVMLLACLFWLLPLLAASALAANAPSFDDADAVLLRGRVISVDNEEPDESVSSFVKLHQLALIEITRGEYKGKQITLENTLMGHPLFDLYLTEGRQVILWGETDDDGLLRNVYLQDFARDSYLYLVVGLFILIMLLVGQRKGLVTVVALSITIFSVFFILLPLLLAGWSPIATTILVAAAVSLVTILFISGLHHKTFAAVIGTVGGVLVAGMLALLVGNAAHLTGFSSEEAQMLMFMEGGPIDVRGLLFAGIIIGSLGAVMDVSVSIAAATYEVWCADRRRCFNDLFSSAMNVGRDIMGTMANTLILAYVGTSAPLLLLFMGYRMPWATIINSDLVATEVVRALAGSIGLIAAIPLTAAASALLMVHGPKVKAKTRVT